MDTATLTRVALGLREQMVAARDQLQVMSDTFYDINAVYESRAGDSASLGPVLSLIKTIIDDTDRFLTMFPENESEAAGATDDTAGEHGGGATSGGGGKPKGFVVTTPQSRADVVTALDAVARFFRENEPTSPVPLMLKRVRAWVEMDFLQLLTEIAPNAVDDAQRLLASPEESSIDYG